MQYYTSFFTTCKSAALFGGYRKFVSRDDLISAIEQYLYFYNNKRYQQRLKCMTPMEFHRAAA
ncbi:MAG: IS3 family transposase [Clostridia bacterium]|nr:IS3 family transposase [Clostridia bacterium]